MRFFPNFISLLTLSSVAVAAAPVENLTARDDCRDLEVGEVTSLPGYDSLATQAFDSLGITGNPNFNLRTNDPAYPTNTALICDNVATGWVWFDFESPVKGHYKWAFFIDDMLSVADRTL
ncbi:hypothetical protein B0H13DRAFT_2361217 [Mycena leptocephala]|nr:hypothetical protein B0H13DRAFT_2361217 [Mycena leptocephala]